MADDHLLIPSLKGEGKEPDVWDGPWRRLSYDPVTGISEWHMYDPATDQTHIRMCQDVEDILDRNQALMNQGDGGWDSEKMFKRVGSIPLVKLREFRNKGINLLNPEFKDELAKFFNDPDHSKTRTGPGRI